MHKTSLSPSKMIQIQAGACSCFTGAFWRRPFINTRQGSKFARFTSISRAPRCTADGTKQFAAKHAGKKFSKMKLLDFELGVFGFGSDWLGSPKVQSKNLTRAIQGGCNLVELVGAGRAAAGPTRPAGDLDYWEMEAITRLMVEGQVAREHLFLFARVPPPPPPPPGDGEAAAAAAAAAALRPDRLRQAVTEALGFHGLECLDGIVVGLPANYDLAADAGAAALGGAVAALEALAGEGRLQTYGFQPARGGPSAALLGAAAAAGGLRHGLALFPAAPPALRALDPAALEAARRRGALRVGDGALCGARRRPCGRPLLFADAAAAAAGNDPAALAARAQDAFNKAMHMETEYMTRFLQQKDTLEVEALPDAVDICWAHILSEKQDEIETLEEWLVVKEKQIIPTLEKSLEMLKDKGNQDTMDFGMLYRMVAFELFETFGAMKEAAKAGEAAALAAELDRLAPSLASHARLRLRRRRRDGPRGGDGDTLLPLGLAGRAGCLAVGAGMDNVLAKDWNHFKANNDEEKFQDISLSEENGDDGERKTSIQDQQKPVIKEEEDGTVSSFLLPDHELEAIQNHFMVDTAEAHDNYIV